MSNEDVSHRFDYHPPATPARVRQHEDARGAFKRLALWADDNLPQGRETALVLTHLETALFWANAAIARQKS